MLEVYNSKIIIAGCDEAGRGCLAGPVVAAAVILPNKIKYLNDSKLLSEKKRNLLKDVIIEKSISFGIGIVNAQEIDKINILNASFLAMHRAIDKLKITPKLLLIDGNRFNKYKTIKHKCIIKGDKKFQSIAAASILAKTYRDDIMMKLDDKYKKYSWKSNKGYPTKSHRKALQIYGTTKYHRKSFQLLTKQLSLKL